ncbi:hypothetical protein IPM62_04070 [Candidatus Woesebacteria bacterium]|nr:MAG: hypothetical protein IPM62_04070 [Candidatus Woesebacteria bacterium]
MKKVLSSFFVIGIIGILVVYSTNAFFSDTETSKGNVFEAGKVDLLVGSECTYNGQASTECGTWDSTNLALEKLFNFSDIKPGDYGENTINLRVEDNPSWLCMAIVSTSNDDTSSTEPELQELGETQEDAANLWDGELRQNMTFHVWADVCDLFPAVPGDNIYKEDCDENITENVNNESATFALADSTSNIFTGISGQSLNGNESYYLGFGWSLPSDVGNIAQTDSFTANISFYAEQERNNASFICPNSSVVFSGDFNDGNIDNWEIIGSHKVHSDLGSWRVENGELLQTNGGDGYMIFADNLNLSTQTLEVDMKHNDPAGYGGFVIWFQDYDNLIYIRMYPGYAEIWVEQWENGVSSVTKYPYLSAYSTWYTFKTFADSDSGNIDVYVNGVKLFTHHATTTKRDGKSGLMNGNSGSFFDNFRLTAN